MAETSIHKRLEALALSTTTPFCLGCYIDAPEGKCPSCDSDDLARHRPGDGVGWDVDWIIPRIIAENVKAIDPDEYFEDSIRSVYDETIRLGWLDVDVADAIKALDPVSWNLAKHEYLDSEVTDGALTTLDGGEPYYIAADVLAYIEAAEADLEDRMSLIEMARDKSHYPGGEPCST